MAALVDTSALYALLDADDPQHGPALKAFSELLEGDAPLVIHSFVVLESVALVQARLGLDAVAGLRDELLPVAQVVWAGAEAYERAFDTLLAARRRAVSLVDWVSFDTMRRLGLRRAFAFDVHFAEQGFELVPGAPDREA